MGCGSQRATSITNSGSAGPVQARPKSPEPLEPPPGSRQSEGSSRSGKGMAARRGLWQKRKWLRASSTRIVMGVTSAWLGGSKAWRRVRAGIGQDPMRRSAMLALKAHRIVLRSADGT